MWCLAVMKSRRHCLEGAANQGQGAGWTRVSPAHHVGLDTQAWLQVSPSCFPSSYSSPCVSPPGTGFHLPAETVAVSEPGLQGGGASSANLQGSGLSFKMARGSHANLLAAMKPEEKLVQVCVGVAGGIEGSGKGAVGQVGGGRGGGSGVGGMGVPPQSPCVCAHACRMCLVVIRVEISE